MPRNVKIASWLLRIAAVLAVVLTVGANRASHHIDGARAAYLAIAKDDNGGLIESLQSALRDEVIAGVIATIVLVVVAVAVRRRRQGPRVVTWWACLLVLVVTALVAGTDATTIIGDGGFDTSEIARAATHLLPAWYEAVVELAEFGIIVAMVAVLVLLIRSSVSDFYHSGGVSDQAGLWDYINRARQAETLNGASGAERAADTSFEPDQ
jgi:hypothetical protein